LANRLVSDLATPMTTTSFRLPLELRPVSIAALLFPAPGRGGWWMVGGGW
jgi:hypothetical protein